MSRGKKFDAAEKHFEKKCVEWRKQVREAEQSKQEYIKKYLDIQAENERLQEENKLLKQQNETLMKMKDLSNKDVKLLLEVGKHSNMLSDMMRVICKM